MVKLDEGKGFCPVIETHQSSKTKCKKTPATDGAFQTLLLKHRQSLRSPNRNSKD